jgi:hypothetical protein
VTADEGSSLFLGRADVGTEELQDLALIRLHHEVARQGDEGGDEEQREADDPPRRVRLRLRVMAQVAAIESPMKSGA